MTTARSLWISLCTVFLVWLLLCTSVAFAQDPVAMITDLSGTATTADGTSVDLLAEVHSGNTITLDAESSMVLVYFASGAEYSFVGPASMEMSAAAPTIISGKQPSARNVLETGGRNLRISPSGKAQASVDMRAVAHEMEIDLLAPAPGSTILEQRPQFTWMAVQGAAKYRIELIDEDLNKVIEATLESAVYELPGEIVLVPGGLYTCHLETRLPDGTPLSTWALFNVASDEQKQLVESSRPPEESSFSEQLVFALWLRQQRFDDEAQRLWHELRAQRPTLVAWEQAPR